LENSRQLLIFAIRNRKMNEGNDIVPFSFYLMSTEIQLEKIGQFLDTILADEPEFFLVSAKIKPTNNIKVFIDGDNGITIEKCVRINRKLYKLIEEAALYPEGDFSLEVSSPGVDEPLKMKRQYDKNIGRFVEVVFNDNEKKEGKLLQVAETGIILEHTSGKGKKAITQQSVIPFDNIKTTTVQIKF
jgi:ribosome maturation factor RimP